MGRSMDWVSKASSSAGLKPFGALGDIAADHHYFGLVLAVTVSTGSKVPAKF